jgi:hypothetical protein
MDIYNRQSYKLLIGKDSVEIFDYFRVKELHGLTRSEAVAYNETAADAYIFGLANYHPLDKNLSLVFKPFIFINKARLNGTYEDVLGLMHEYLHMAQILSKGINDSNEEGVVTWIENEIKWIIDSGIVGIFEQSSTHYMNEIKIKQMLHEKEK